MTGNQVTSPQQAKTRVGETHGCVCVCGWIYVCFLESETAEGFLKLAWRQADACKYVFMKTLALKCAFKYVWMCVCMEREQRSRSPSTIFIFTSIHEHLTPCRACAFAGSVCVCVEGVCVCSDHMPGSPLYNSAGWDAFFLLSVVTESLLWSHCNPIIKQWCTFYHAGLAEVFVSSVSNERTCF